MKKSVLLPFEYAPEAVTYHSIAFPMGIVQGNARQSVIPWLSSRYINCWFSSDLPCQFTFFDADNWGIEDKTLFHRQINLHHEQFHTLIGGSQTSLLKKMIQLGYYPYGIYNEEFIPGKEYFKKCYHAHDFLLCGYDDGMNSFISAGYLSNEMFQQFLIPYECMERAVTTLRRSYVSYDFWKYNHEATYQFNRSKIIQQLDDYLNSTNSQPVFMPGCTWGLRALMDAGRFIEDWHKKENNIEHRCTRSVLEHKKLMHMRIDYLLSSSIVNDRRYLACAQEALLLSKAGHLLGVKFRFTKDDSIPYRINNIYQKIVTLEKSYLPAVLSSIRHSIG